MNLRIIYNINKMKVYMIYIMIYFIYVIIGYNSLNRYKQNKPLDLVCFNKSSFTFIGRRMCMLSLISHLFSAYFFYLPNINTFINAFLINMVSIIGYYCKWRIDEALTFYSHIFWVLPVILYAIYLKLDYSVINNGWIYLLIFLYGYSFIQKYVYLKRDIP